MRGLWEAGDGDVGRWCEWEGFVGCAGVGVDFDVHFTSCRRLARGRDMARLSSWELLGLGHCVVGVLASICRLKPEIKKLGGGYCADR